MKTFIVEIFPYPVEVRVQATNETEARELAKAQVNFSVWESVATECEEYDRTGECGCDAFEGEACVLCYDDEEGDE